MAALRTRIAVRPEPPALPERPSLSAFVSLCGPSWARRIEALKQAAATGPRRGRAVRQRHALELAIAAMLESGRACTPAVGARLGALAAGAVALHQALPPAGRARLAAMIEAGLSGTGTLVPLFHLLRTIALQEGRGFTVAPHGLADGTPFDLLLEREGETAELSCETVSAEDGRDLHRSAWFDLVDGIDPDLQTWLSAHPGRYLLKMTLPNGLKQTPGGDLATLAELQRRIREMLFAERRADHDEAAVLRLDPLLIAGAQAGELGLMETLRQQFGPEAHLAMTKSGQGLFVMAARAGRENYVAEAVRARMAAAVPVRFSGGRPAILSMFLDDLDRVEWRALRDGLQLEGETRHFLTCPEAAGLVAVAASTRVELLDDGAADAAREGELRFRNQAHRAAKSAALAPAIKSSC